MSEQSKRSGRGIVGDMLVAVPGWLALMLVDPWTATAAYVPVTAALIFARRTWWAERPVGGRIVVAVLAPILALFLTTALVFRSTGPALAGLLAAAVLALAEGWNRRKGRTLVRRHPLLTTAAFLALSSALCMLMLSWGVIRYPTEEFIKIMSTPPEAPEWSRPAKKQAVTAVESALTREIRTRLEARELRDELADRKGDLIAADSPRGVYVTLYENSGYRARGQGSGGRDALEDVLFAAVDAAGKVPRKSRSSRTRPRLWGDPMVGVRVQIDVVGESRGITFRPLFYLFEPLFRGVDKSINKLEQLGLLLHLTYEIESGVDGVEIHRPQDRVVAVMLPAEPVTEGWFTPRVRSGPRKMRNILRRTWYMTHGESLDLETQEFTVRKFRTTSFGRPRVGAEVVDWYRANVLLEGELTRAELIARIGQTADWLSRRVKPDGGFHYEMHPPFRFETKSYNLPRHAGSVYSLLATYQVSRREPQLEAAGRRALRAGLTSLGYIERALGVPESHGREGDLCFMDEKGRAASGSTALAAIALCDMPRAAEVDEADLKDRLEQAAIDEWLTGMGSCMLRMIDADGAVWHNYEQAATQERVEKEPLYFPGEVMLALVRSYKRLEEDRLLEGARRIADRQLRQYRWPLMFDIPSLGDHWIIQALTELTEVTDDEQYAELAILMGKGYVREQHPPQEFSYPDYLGAYRRVADQPRTTRAASRGEALGAALRAAIKLGEDTTEFEDALILGARHLLEQQFTMRNSHFIPVGWDVQGGIRMGLVDNHLRIDNNQHALVGLFAALQAMDLRTARDK
jgi:hypothetical protein